jgi:hypothetical protein
VLTVCKQQEKDGVSDRCVQKSQSQTHLQLVVIVAHKELHKDRDHFCLDHLIDGWVALCAKMQKGRRKGKAGEQKNSGIKGTPAKAKVNGTHQWTAAS